MTSRVWLLTLAVLIGVHGDCQVNTRYSCRCENDTSTNVTCHNPVFSQIPNDVVHPSTDLMELNITGGHLGILQPLLFPNLQMLYIQQSQLTLLRDLALSGLTNLEGLVLKHNRITAVNAATFANLKQLKYLDLSYNSLTSIHEGAFQDLVRLETLILSDNAIVKIVDSPFISLQRLVKLDLSSNQLSGTLRNESLRGLAALETLKLGNNQLSAIDGDALRDCRSRLRVLYLNHNRLETLSRNLVQWRYVLGIDLSGNPWNCDCRLTWMKGLPNQDMFRFR